MDRQGNPLGTTYHNALLYTRNGLSHAPTPRRSHSTHFREPGIPRPVPHRGRVDSLTLTLTQHTFFVNQGYRGQFPTAVGSTPSP